MPELHLKQPAARSRTTGFTCLACVPFIRHLERIKKLKETAD